jgi:hypothetical protein
MEVAANAALLACALAWRGVVGWVVRARAERFAGTRLGIAHPALDLLIGLLAGWTAFAIWSALLKRGLGTSAPLIVFAVLEAIVVVALGAREVAARRAAGWAPLPDRTASIRLAALVAVFAALATGAIFTFESEDSDQDQHVAWAAEIAQQGVVPDQYAQAAAAIDYPLGLHALAASASAAIVSPVVVLNVLPLLTSILVVAVICAAVRGLAVDAGPPSVSGTLLETGSAIALTLVLFSGHFSVWSRYLVNPRLVGGLVHLVPVIAWAWALVAAPLKAGGRASGALVAALVVSGALAAVLNPVLVPLQGILSGVALATAALRRHLTWKGLGGGLVVGGAAGVLVVGADPYLARRADLPGLRPAPAPYLQALQADFNRNFTGRTCLTGECLRRAFTSPQTLTLAAEPWAALTLGAIELLHRPPSPLRFDQPPAGGHRFPDLTGVGLAPVHGRAAPYVFAALPWLFAAAAWVTRRRRLAWAAAGVAAAIGLEAVLRAIVHGVVNPIDPALRLLPYYMDVASAVFFTQLLWPLLFVGTLFAGWAGDSGPRRAVRAGVAVVALVVLAASATGEVRRGMAWGRPYDVPSRADVGALARLEARVVPAGEAFLVATRHSEGNGERWIAPADEALLWYLHARRPTLFLYFLDHTARHGLAGLEATCAGLEAGARDTLLTRYHARWALSPARPDLALPEVGRRLFCGRRMAEWFPAMRVAGTEGRLTIVELWRDPR